MSTGNVTISLVRHGQTNYNVSGFIQGQLDIPLNEEGIRQAQKLAATLPVSEYDIIYASDLSRALDTAKILSTAATPNMTIRQDTRLRERSYGNLEAQHRVHLRFMAYTEGKNMLDCTPEGAETPEKLHERVVEFLKTRLIEDIEAEGIKKPKILIVSHGGAIRSMIRYFSTLGDGTFPNVEEVSCSNASVGEFMLTYAWDEKDPFKTCIKQVKCIKVNDISHLEEPKDSQHF